MLTKNINIQTKDTDKNDRGDFIESVNSLLEKTENDFMLLGLGLQAVHVNVKELTRLMLGTVERIGSSEDGGIMDRIELAAGESLKEIRNFHDEVNSTLVRITAVVETGNPGNGGSHISVDKKEICFRLAFIVFVPSKIIFRSLYRKRYIDFPCSYVIICDFSVGIGCLL